MFLWNCCVVLCCVVLPNKEKTTVTIDKPRIDLTQGLIVVGSTGLGKSTFINTLFNRTVIPVRINEDAKDAHLAKTMKIETYNFGTSCIDRIETEEYGSKLSISVIDTPGFGDNIRNSDQYSMFHNLKVAFVLNRRFEDIDEFIKNQFNQFLEEETRIKRNPKFQDTRLHVMLYFIAPNGQGLKEIDIEFMKKLGKIINVIPIIAKADAFTKQEMESFKSKIRQDLTKYDIPVFNFTCESDEEDEEIKELNLSLQSVAPFSVIGSDTEYEVGKQKVRGRKYLWGIAEVDNANHCDFKLLKSVLLDSHLQELKDITNDVLYENYRTDRLSSKDNAMTVSELRETESKEKLDLFKSKEKIIQDELASKMKERIEIEEKLKESNEVAKETIEIEDKSKE